MRQIHKWPVMMSRYSLQDSPLGPGTAGINNLAASSVVVCALDVVPETVVWKKLFIIWSDRDK